MFVFGTGSLSSLGRRDLKFTPKTGLLPPLCACLRNFVTPFDKFEHLNLTNGPDYQYNVRPGNPPNITTSFVLTRAMYALGTETQTLCVCI